MSNPGNTDARVRFSLSEDGMKLGVSRYFPATGAGQPLTAEAICSQLKSAGLQQAPQPGAPERIVELLQQGKSLKSVVLVRGKPAREPADAEIVPEGDLRFPAFPGQIVARKLPPSQGEPGRTIDGRSIAPNATTTEKKRDLAVQSGENCSFDQTKNIFTAQVYGMVSIQEDAVHVIPALTLTEDLTKLLGTIHFKDITGQAITPERFKDELKRLEITLDIDEESICAGVARAKAERKLQKDVPVVSGKEPVNGADGWLEYLVQTHAGQDAGKLPGMVEEAENTEGDQDKEPLRIDYRERGALPTAKPGEVIARLHQPEPGDAGIDVYGRPIPAHSGKKLSILAGENVTAGDEGFFTARDTGLVVVERGVLMVTQLLVINHDVDISVGHIRAELGSVRVRGSVQTGMEIQAPKHIIVDHTVESANIEAGGNIVVGGGILMDEKGLVRAGGDVTASFATGAIIQAGGDMEITTNVTNSQIDCKGTLYAIKGKGIIQGGKILVHNGLEAKEIGTEMGVKTTISVNIPPNVTREMAQNKHKIKRELKRIKEAIGAGDPKDILIRTRPEKRKAVAEIIKKSIRLQKKLNAINKEMKALKEKRQEEMANARISVWTSIHPGVTIKIGGRVLEVTRRHDRSTLYWSRSERRIIIGNLQSSEARRRIIGSTTD